MLRTRHVSVDLSARARERDRLDRSALSDAVLVARARDGDVRARDVLVERYADRVARIAHRRLRDPEEARDAAQEVFLKAFRSAGSYRPQGQVYTWLYRIAVNHCLNKLRRRRIVRFLRWTDPADPDETPPFDPPDETPDAAAALATREQWRTTRQAIAALPENQRAVLILTRFEGLSYRQIAEVLGITEGAVESRLFRAMRRLQATQEPGETSAQKAAQEAGASRVSPKERKR